MTQQQNDEYDVVVIGGGAAGLGAAVTLGRSRRAVAVVDGGQPRNAPAAGVHGYLTRDGIPPAELVRMGRLEAQGYGADLLDGEVEQVTRSDDGRLDVRLAGGRTLTARRLMVATGLVDELPEVPGLRERWGRDVLHCPYCHGWEVRDQQIAVLASGPMSVHQALLFRQLTDQVTYLSHAQPPTPEQEEQLLARGVRIVGTQLASIEVTNDRLTGVRLADGTAVACQAVAVATSLRARAGFLGGIGLQPVEHPLGVGEHLPVDPQGRTTAAGVWAAGNVTDPFAQVGAASAAGAFAGAQINADLAAEDTRLAVEARRAEHAVAAHDHDEFDAAYWEDRYSHGRGASRRDPSPSLLAEAADLPPGAALDAGCGWGADAVWLATRGWSVTAVDVSPAAVDQARQHAQAADPRAAARVAFLPADLTTWQPDQRFDLVTSHYVHVPGPQEALFARLASWVAPGGTLLIVGHGDTPGQHGHRHAHDAGHHDAGHHDAGHHDAGHHDAGHGEELDSPPDSARVRVAQITSALPEAEWEIVTAEPRTHTISRPGGGPPAVLDDVVVRARRL